MQPLGKYVFIQPINEETGGLFREREVLARAKVLKITPDEQVGFCEGDIVYYVRGKLIELENITIAHIDNIFMTEQ